MKLVQDPGDKIASFAHIHNVGPIGRCKVNSLTAAMLEAHEGDGLVVEQDIGLVNEIAFSAKLQTISYTVTDELTTPKGEFKRVVPLGKALEFAPVWDGVDLPEAFW